jgi:hypothetical protein
MNRLARIVVRLYPSRWRARYGLELNALIEDSGAKPLDLLDLLAGALKMQFSYWKFPVGLALAGLAIATLAVEFVPKSYLADIRTPRGEQPGQGCAESDEPLSPRRSDSRRGSI